MRNIPLIAAICIVGTACAQSTAQVAFKPSSNISMEANDQASGYELVSFLAEPANGEGITLRWNTGGEAPNSIFTVERSSDRMNWRTVFTQEGEGGIKGYTAYEVMDLAPVTGISYYRLITSKGGDQLDISDDFAVEYAPASALHFTNEPVAGRFRVQGEGAITDLQVLNNRGQFMPMDLHYDGGQVLVNAEGLEPGTYFVQAVVDGVPVLRTVIVTATGVIGG